MCVVQHGPPHLMSTLTVSSASDGSANLTATSRPSTEPPKPSDLRLASVRDTLDWQLVMINCYSINMLMPGAVILRVCDRQDMQWLCERNLLVDLNVITVNNDVITVVVVVVAAGSNNNNIIINNNKKYVLWNAFSHLLILKKWRNECYLSHCHSSPYVMKQNDVVASLLVANNTKSYRMSFEKVNNF